MPRGFPVCLRACCGTRKGRALHLPTCPRYAERRDDDTLRDLWMGGAKLYLIGRRLGKKPAAVWYHARITLKLPARNRRREQPVG